jgi:hypothetical protein
MHVVFGSSNKTNLNNYSRISLPALNLANHAIRFKRWSSRMAMISHGRTAVWAAVLRYLSPSSRLGARLIIHPDKVCTCTRRPLQTP